MKEAFKLFFAALMLSQAVACNNNAEEKPATGDGKDSLVVVPPPVVINKDSLLAATGKAILELLENRNYATLGNHFLPGMPVRFSPYGYVDTSRDVKLDAKQLSDLVSSGKKIHWGEQDGSGDPIQLSARDYFSKYVYSADFLHAEQTAIDRFIGSGNSLNNLKMVYPGSRFIEYHFSGFDKKYGGMDWTSLRLVFKEMNDRYYLVAVVHDQWTT